MSSVNPDHEVALAKLQYDHQLARLGLQGTLYGSFASLVAIAVIALGQIFTGRYVIEGWAFAGMVAAIVIPVTFYGAFIFKSALNISAKIAKEGGSFSASSAERDQTHRDRPPKA